MKKQSKRYFDETLSHETPEVAVLIPIGKQEEHIIEEVMWYAMSSQFPLRDFRQRGLGVIEPVDVALVERGGQKYQVSIRLATYAERIATNYPRSMPAYWWEARPVATG